MVNGQQTAGAAHAALDFVRNHHDGVRGAQLADAAQEARRHREESRFALHRLDDHRRHRRRIHLRDERVFELANAEVDVVVGRQTRRRPVHVRNRQTDDFGGERTKSALEQSVLAREAQGEQRAAVIAALETDNRRPAGVFPRQLDGVLNGFGAAVGQDGLLAERSGRRLVQDLRQAHVRLVGRHQRTGMDVFRSLRLNGPHNRRRRVPNRQHADPAGEVDQRIAVGVENKTAVGALHHHVGCARQARRSGCRAARQHLAGARPRNRRLHADERDGMLARGASHLSGGVKHEEHAVVAGARIVQIVGEQRPRLEADAELHRQRGVPDSAVEDRLIVLLRRHAMFHGAVIANHAGRDLSLEPQAPDALLTRGIQRGTEAASPVLGSDAQICAVQPRPAGLVRRQPAALNDLGEGVTHMIEVEVEANGARGADNPILVNGDELAILEELDMPAIVRRLEPLRIIERREAGPLQLLELIGVLDARLHHDEAVGKAAVVPHERSRSRVAKRSNHPRGTGAADCTAVLVYGGGTAGRLKPPKRRSSGAKQIAREKTPVRASAYQIGAGLKLGHLSL